MIPFDDIRRSQNRSWSLPLVEMLERGEVEDAHEICRTIGALEDPRLPTRLLQILEDVERPFVVRELAANALNESVNIDTAEQRQRWWQSGDQLLMRHAVRMAESTENDLLLNILKDGSSPFYLDALNVIQWWEEPCLQSFLVAALRHDDPMVRETAADCLVWEQPNGAAADLLILAADARHEDVAIGAMNTLNYYSTQEVLLRFAELLRDGPDELRENYQAGFDYVRQEFIDGCRWAMSENMAIRDHLLVWLQPVIHLFNLEDFQIFDRASTSLRRTKSSHPLMTVDEIIADLSESDACWADKLHKYNGNHDWSWLSVDDAVRLVQFLAAHGDLNVRELACSIAGHRKLSDLLFDLLNDPTSRVKKTASYHSRMLSSERRFRDRLWQILMSPDTRGFFATETLESYLVHANDRSVDAQLKELALEGERPSVKAAAVSALRQRGALGEINSVSCLLLEPAFNNWWVHRNILDACAELRVAARIDHLLMVDDVYLQVAVAEYRAAMNGS